jgi:hypothetical protein
LTEIINLNDSARFAELSGDFNPLHIDILKARRMMFGTTVVHGVHILLVVLNTYFSAFKQKIRLTEIKVKFKSPIHSGQTWSVEKTKEAFGKVTFNVKTANSNNVKISVSYTEIDHHQQQHEINCSIFPRAPEKLSFEGAKSARGSLTLSVNQNLLQKMFPVVSAKFSNFQTATLLASTRIVGMKCPGLHSTFLQLNLKFKDTINMKKSELDFSVKSANQDLSYLALSVKGPGIEGEIISLFRPPPVKQPTYFEVQNRVDPHRYLGRKALIIGGSRGLGEVATKIFSAGGGEVRFTYYAGHNDAKNVAKEICDENGNAFLINFDVLNSGGSDLKAALKSWKPSDILYFATPQIVASKTDKWNQELFTNYRLYYADGLKRTLEIVQSVWSLQDVSLFYPSTIYIDAPQTGFNEYAEAKKVGEKFCLDAGDKFEGLSCTVTRLPRVLTDQTNGYLRKPTTGALETLLKLLN